MNARVYLTQRMPNQGSHRQFNWRQRSEDRYPKSRIKIIESNHIIKSRPRKKTIRSTIPIRLTHTERIPVPR